MRMTTKQHFIMDLIAKAELSGSCLDIDQLIDGLEKTHHWYTTKQSIQFSIRALVGHGVIEKRALSLRRSRHRVTFSITDLGKKMLGIDLSGCSVP